jgi:peptidoglycan/LPS O-acetylase OafA/YrhL
MSHEPVVSTDAPNEIGLRSTASVTGGKRLEIRHLTGVRIIAAFWVVLYHYQVQIYGLLPELKFLAPITSIGYLAVDLFFVLSGFILCYQYLDRFRGKSTRHYWGFLWKRLARIYPAHLAVLLGLAALVILSKFTSLRINDPQNFDTAGFLLDLFIVRSWVGDSQGWNIPAWSLSAEWLAYVLFPLFAVTTIWLTRRRSAAVLFAVGVLISAEGVATWIYPSSHMPIPAARILLAFGFGCFVYVLTQRTSQSPRNGWLGIASLGALMTVPAVIPVGGLRASVALVLAGATIYFLALGTGAAVGALGSRWPEFGGQISFSVYLIHVPLLMLLVRVFPVAHFAEAPVVVRALIVAAHIVSVIIAGALLYRLVEMPAQDGMMKLLLRRRRGRTLRRH